MSKFKNITYLLFLFIGLSCVDRKKEDKIFSNNTYYFDTSKSLFKNDENAKLFEKSKELHLKGAYDKCLEILLDLEKSEPENKLVLGSLGISYLGLKEYDTSEKYLKKAIRLDSEFFNNWINLSKLYIATKKYELADKILLEIVDLKKTEEEEWFCLMQRATVNYHLGNCYEALAFCEDAIKISKEEWFLDSAKNAYEDIKKDCIENMNTKSTPTIQ